MYFSFLAHFAINSLVAFAELSILLCYEVFVLKFYLQSFNLRLIFVRHFVCPSLISLFCTQFHFFALVKLHCSLIWD